MQYLDEVKNLRQKQAARRRAGEYGKCVAIGEKLRQLHRRHRNTRSMNYADDLFNLAMMYEETGSLEHAAKLYADSIKIIGELIGFGLEYADRLTAAGVCCVKYGDLEDALEMFTRAEQIRRERLGDEHPATADAVYNIGNCLLEQGLFKEALEYHARALNALGKETGGVARVDSLNGCAYCHEALGNAEEAKKYFAKALERGAALFGTESGEYAADLMYYAEFLSKNELHEEALKCFNKCAKIVKKLNTENDLSYAGVINCAAGEYEKLGNIKKMLSLKSKALDILTRSLGENHLYFANYMKSIALKYHRVGDAENAIRMMRKTLKIKESIIGCQNDSYAKDLLTLTFFHLERTDYKSMTRALKHALKKADPKNPATPKYYEGIQDLCMVTNELAKLVKDAGPNGKSAGRPISEDLRKAEALAELLKQINDNVGGFDKDK